MMLTIHGLPSVANYQDVRTLLQRECNLNDFILDNLVSDKNGTKKVRIGVADEIEGAHVIKCLDGFRCGGKVLYVIPVGKSQGPQNVQPAFNPQGNFQGNDFPVPINQYGPPGQVGSGAGQWNTDQWAPNQPAVGGYDYPQQNVPFQQQSQQPQRPLNQRELMLQASRVPVQDSYQGRSGNSKQSLVPPPSRPALRNIETVDLPKDGSDRYQNYEPKPITIKKDNFMGPDQFQGSPQGSYPQGHGQSPSWMDQGPHHKQGFGKPNQPYADDKKAKAGILKNPHADRDKYNEKPHFTPQRRDSPGRRKSPGRNISPGGRLPSDQRIQRDGRMSDLPARNDRMGPNGPLDHSARNDRMGPNDRRMPTDTRLGPDDRRMPMNDDRMGPNDRRLGPNDRRMPVNDDRMGPNDRRIPINDDRMGPNDRRMPIADRMLVNDRKMPLNDNRMGPNDHRMMPKDDRMGLTVPNTGRRISPPSRRVSPSGRRVSPSGRRLSPPGRRDGPMGRHISPPLRQISPGRRISPSGRRMSPHGRRMSPSGRRMSPSGRRLSPPGRRLSPPGRRMSPSGRRMSPPGRRMSPSGRRMSPSGRRMSPSGRRMSPTDKRISPDRRLRSPGRRSPNRRMSPEPHARPMRYSPGRDKDRLKQIRPAYEPDSKAANQAMYSGGYRPTNEPPPYRAGAPVPVPERISPWQTRDKYAAKKDDDLRKDFSRIPEEKRISPRASRSPHRRDRSPVRDRYRRHSPSPRSPRRSWALEKRRSPDHDAPPPPAWPGQPQEFPRSNRPDKDEKGPVWEKPYNKIDDEFQRDSIRVRKDLIHARDPPRREPSPHRFKQEDRRDDRYREPKYERDDYHDRRFPEPDRRKLPDREEFIARSERAHEQFKKEESPKRQPPRLDQYRKKHEQIEEEFQDIYQRAVDFAKKTQELKKHEHMKDESRHGRDFFDRHEERPRSRHSDEYRKREPEWDTDPRKRMAPSNLAKREKAADEISRRIIQKYVHQVEPEVKNKVMDEIKNNIFNKIYDMYGDQDISYIECIIKFNTRDSSAEERIFHEAASKYSVQYRGMKRSMPAPSEVPAKMARRSPQPDVKLGSDAKPTGTINRVRGPRGCKRKKLKESLPGETPATQRVDTDSYPYIIPPPAPAPKKFYAHRNAEDMFSYELNPLMSRMIDVELQDVMIKVWQSLPDEPNSDAEKLVAEKFRTDVGDTFRNVLGLNVAKRLLNIFNKLMLKIQFSAMPARANLRAFLKKYSFVSFKRIVGTTKSFHAQVKTVQDFDWLCTSKELYCGTSKVTVTPHYKFIQRPDKLKTTFNKSNVEKPKTDVASEKDVKETSKDDTQDKKEEVKSVVKEVAKTTQAETTIQAKPATTNTQNKPAQVKTTTAKNVPKTTQNAKEAKPNEEAPVKNNASATTNTNSNMSKTTQNTKEANEVAVKTNLTATKPNTRSNVPKTAQNTKEAKPNEVAPVKTNSTAIKAPVTTTPAKTAQAKTNTPTTATQNKPDTKVTPEAKPNTPQAKTNASVNKTPIAKSAPQAKPKVNQKTTPNQVKPTKTIAKAKVPAKAQEMKKKSPNTKTKKNPLQGKGDFEELDDYDILALMSGGIVLDECSGSDVE